MGGLHKEHSILVQEGQTHFAMAQGAKMRLALNELK